MCVQCMLGAMTAGSAVTGSRTWLAAQPWITPQLLRRCTIVLLLLGLLAASTILSGSETSTASARSAAARAVPAHTR